MSRDLITTNEIKDSSLTDVKFATGLTVAKLTTPVVTSGVITDSSVGYEKTVYAISPNLLRNGGLDFNTDVPPTNYNSGSGLTVTATGDGLGDPSVHSRPPYGPGYARRFERTGGGGTFIGFSTEVDLLARKFVRTNAGGGGPSVNFTAILSGIYMNNLGGPQAYARMSVYKDGPTTIAGPVSFQNNSVTGASGTPWRPFTLSLSVPDPGVTVSTLRILIEFGQVDGSSGRYTYFDDLALFTSSITG